MAGKAQLPDGRRFPQHDLKGSSAGTPGLTALDEEREASLADEGGASGARVESQDEDRLRADSAGRAPGPRRGRRPGLCSSRRPRPGPWSPSSFAGPDSDHQ